MNLAPACIECIASQAKRVASTIGANEELTASMNAAASRHLSGANFSLTPPQVATPLYEELARLACKPDLYDEAKLSATHQAQKYIPQLAQELLQSATPLLDAAKIAVAGNVIDLATMHTYDLGEDIKRVIHTPFAVDDFASLFEDIKYANKLLYLADNAGEHIFDKLFIQTIKQKHPKLEIYFATRGNAIINDVTYQEAHDSGIEEVAHLVNSGVPTPGFLYELANAQTKELFDSVDVVIAKGMGNFETMTQSNKRRVYHLFKVKCEVVADFVGHEVGSFMALSRDAQPN